MEKTKKFQKSAESLTNGQHAPLFSDEKQTSRADRYNQANHRVTVDFMAEMRKHFKNEDTTTMGGANAKLKSLNEKEAKIPSKIARKIEEAKGKTVLKQMNEHKTAQVIKLHDSKKEYALAS
ncbi:MAG: hypothetical protein FWG18_02815 [Alphaproteobacteria bacterium]|nr:hypothetical protein [Alphaproteobacteria bacterium]